LRRSSSFTGTSVLPKGDGNVDSLNFVVNSSAEIQLQRLIERDKSTRDNARARLESQLAITEKLGYADIVMDNSGTRAELEVQVDEFARRLYVEGGWSWRVKWLIPPIGVVSAIWTLIWRRVKYARKGVQVSS
jgi:dephospho-CoA kinase